MDEEKVSIKKRISGFKHMSQLSCFCGFESVSDSKPPRPASESQDLEELDCFEPPELDQNTSHVCLQCRSIPLELFHKDGFEYELFPSRSALFKSAKDCTGCNFWTQYCKTGRSYRATSYVRKKRPVFLRNNNSGIYLELKQVHKSTPILYWVDAGTEHEKRWGAWLCADPVSPGPISLMKALIDDCIENHTHFLCKEPGTLFKQPARLIDLGELEKPSQLLRIIPGTEAKSPYLALSHCWGVVPEKAPWKLLGERFDEYTKGFSENLLPKTYLDAIKMTRALGQRYIWIDSLCIIQDSASDWGIQARTMADIYTNALCTLSSGSSSADDGCYWDRKPTLVLELTSISDPTRVGTVALNHQHICNQDSGAPVYYRAWCFQERELSKRMIQFTKKEFLWACGERQVSEWNYCGTTKGPILERFDARATSRRPWDHDNREFGSELPDTKPEEIYELYYNYWYDRVTAYSNKELTIPSDRLVAIDGVMERVMPRFPNPEQYVAGMWVSDMARGLLWLTSFQDQRKRHSKNIAPTWSWASVNTGVYFYHRVQYSKGRFISFPHTKSVSFMRPPFAPDLVSVMPLLRVLGSSMKARVCVSNPGSLLQLCDQMIPEKLLLLAVWDWPSEPLNPEEEFDCLILDTGYRTDHLLDGVTDGQYRKPYGIILKALDLQGSYYERVGFFKPFLENRGDSLREFYETWSSAWQYVEALQPEYFNIV